MTAEKSFYDFNLGSLQERRERNHLFPELARFHIALREELTEEEYEEFFNAERESFRLARLQNQISEKTWALA